MLSKADKKGPELLIPTDKLFEALKNMAKTCKANHDEFNYEVLNTNIAVLTKFTALAIQVKECATLERNVAKALNESADWKEQLFPLLTSCEGCKYHQGRHCIVGPDNHCTRKAEDLYMPEMKSDTKKEEIY